MLCTKPTGEAVRAPPPLLVEHTPVTDIGRLAGHVSGYIMPKAARWPVGALLTQLHTVAELLRGRGRLHAGTTLVLATLFLGRGWGIIRGVARIQLFPCAYVPNRVTSIKWTIYKQSARTCGIACIIAVCPWYE